MKLGARLDAAQHPGVVGQQRPEAGIQDASAVLGVFIQDLQVLAHDLIDAGEALVRADPRAVVRSQRQSSDDRDAEVDRIAFEVGKPGSGTRVAINLEGGLHLVRVQRPVGVVVCAACYCRNLKFIDTFVNFFGLRCDMLAMNRRDDIVNCQTNPLRMNGKAILRLILHQSLNKLS